MGSQVTNLEVEQARQRISRAIRQTPLEFSRPFSAHFGCQVLLKLECLQATGSFKLRGAASRMTALTEEERRSGVLTVSAGNHGLGVAHCAEQLGINTAIVVPRSASRAKVEAIRQYPVELIESGADYDQAERDARRMAAERGLTFVSPYNDPLVIAGQGTVALEILEQDSGVQDILVPVGGGGLLAGVLVTAAARAPHVKVYGVEPAASPTMTRSLEAGRIVEIAEEETLADGCAGNIEPGSITFPLVRDHVAGMMQVTEQAIARALVRMAREHHLMIEGSAAVALAALADPRLRGRRVAALVTGRNITLDLFLNLGTQYPFSPAP